MKKRQEKVLMAIVKEYVKKAEPISSQYLYEKYKLDASPATIRLDMAELTENGFLYQPHTSAGRIPTEKAYHYYINKISQPKLSQKTEKELREIFLKRKKREDDFFEELGEFLARVSHNLALFCLENTIFWQGLSILFSQPEFYQREEILDFAKTFEEVYEKLKFKSLINNYFQDLEDNIGVFWGDENDALVPAEDLSLILGKIHQGFIGLLGPKRMNYEKNIALLKRTIDLLEEYYN